MLEVGQLLGAPEQGTIRKATRQNRSVARNTSQVRIEQHVSALRNPELRLLEL